MPCLRGIELSLVVQPDSVQLPEFPHPDASSVRIASVGDAISNIQDLDAASPGSDSPRIQKTSPRASVYVPSIPGSQFWVQYSIHRHPEPACYLYLKLFINGRSITSCGIKPGAGSGIISRALFEPSDRWHLQQNGMLLKRSGIESRSFCFAPGPDAVAAAEDGGLIEVQVFRAKSRRRSTHQLAPYRDQEQYGIISPSTGLLEHPEDAIYYEWNLQDAIDAPYATFCFHYRAWSYLWDLNLVVDDGNSLLYDDRLYGRFGGNRHQDDAHNIPREGLETELIDLDMVQVSPHDDTQITAPRLGLAEVNEEPYLMEERNNHQRRRHKRSSSSSTRPPRRTSHSHAHAAPMMLLPPVMEEDVFTDSHESPGHRKISASTRRFYAHQHFYSGFRRPLPTVNEVPRLE
ncbi:hypothetical protein CCMA1212_007999 [Trichoderma ghanense]|uniref:Uncharacterized protein n=1 Tax=Trichoderma ghanense TaxID=65468 RepID=A0ABY2GX47_9HYPO